MEFSQVFVIEIDHFFYIHSCMFFFTPLINVSREMEILLSRIVSLIPFLKVLFFTLKQVAIFSISPFSFSFLFYCCHIYFPNSISFNFSTCHLVCFFLFPFDFISFLKFSIAPCAHIYLFLKNCLFTWFHWKIFIFFLLKKFLFLLFFTRKYKV